MNAPVSVTLPADYLDQCNRKSAAYQAAVWNAACKLKYGFADEALELLRTCLERFEDSGANILWPTPPTLSEEEMTQLIAEDEAADERQARWEASKELSDSQGGPLT